MSTWELDGPDTVDHYRTMTARLLKGGLEVIIKLDLHDTGHRAIEVGCYVEERTADGGVMMSRIGLLEGRFGETEGQFGCHIHHDTNNCICMEGEKWENMPHDPNAEDQSRTGGDVLHIENLRINMGWRGRGIGTIMASETSEVAQGVGTKHIVLIPMDIDAYHGEGAPPPPGIAVAFWECQGYRQVGRTDWYCYHTIAYTPRQDSDDEDAKAGEAGATGCCVIT